MKKSISKRAKPLTKRAPKRSPLKRGAGPLRTAAAPLRADVTTRSSSGSASESSVRESAAILDAAEPVVGPSFAIVGIGASAGGLEAVRELLHELPADSGMAYVLVQHLSPEHESSLPQILAPSTRMPVVQASDATVVERDHVYIIPPNVQLELVDGN